MPHRSSRALALAALGTWRQGDRFADAIIQQRLAESSLGASDRSFAVELFYGVLRNLTLLDFWIARLRSGALDASTRDLLRLGLYQVQLLHTPSHAAVFETVALGKPHQRGLVNAVLRNAVRQSSELDLAREKTPPSVRASHPDFFIRRWSDSFGEAAAESLCAWNNQPAPLYARVNLLRMSPKDFLESYPESAVLPEMDNFVRLPSVPIDALARGDCYMQDPSTRVACELLAPAPGESVLDACAAPGGKTAFLAELMENRGELLACDRDAARVQTLRENLERLGVTIARTMQHDWEHGRIVTGKTDPPAFDRILVDAPCSNTGVMRRRVDVRWRLTADDFTRMQNEQLRILQAVLPALKNGGVLVYSTCSIEPEENEQVVERLIVHYSDLELVEQRSVLPFRDGFDGAFAARFVRRS